MAEVWSGLGSPWNRPDLDGQIAVVTGSTRGVGRGIAEVLGECGATVYVTGRSIRDEPSLVNEQWREPEWSVEAAAEAVTAAGGRGIGHRCDHLDDAQVKDLFARIEREHGHLDLLVNNAIGSDMSAFAMSRSQFAPIWKKPIAYWDQNMTIGVRSSFVACRYGLPLMIGHQSLVVFTSEAARDSHPDPIYDLRAHTTARMAHTFGTQLAPQQVATACVVPGDPQTHTRARLCEEAGAPPASESVHFTGRAVASLAGDPLVMDLSGSALTVAELADHYGFTDIDAASAP